MKLFKILNNKNINYYSYGCEFDESENMYWYLQTASNSYEDCEIISSKYKFIPLFVGIIISILDNKRLVRWL